MRTQILAKIKSANMTNTHIVVEAYKDIDKIQHIDRERIDTMQDPMYIQWVKEFKVGQLYTSRELIHNANRLMKQYTHRIGEE